MPDPSTDCKLRAFRLGMPCAGFEAACGRSNHATFLK